MLKEHTIELADGTKEYVVELTDAPRKECALAYFIESLNFVRETEKFKTAQLHRYLKFVVCSAFCEQHVQGG